MRNLSFLLFALLAPPLLVAQHPKDSRLSPAESPNYDLPAQYRIQSADRLEGRTLVVWGTSRSLNSSNVVGQLHYQLLDGAALLDSPRVLTDTAARPFDFVQVIPGYAFFLVVWRDARTDAPGLYAQRVGKDGSLLGKSIRISPGNIKQTTAVPGILAFGWKDRVLIWQDSRPDSAGLYVLHLSGSGALGFPAVRVGDDLRDLVRFNSLSGITILRTSDTAALMVHPEGRIDNRVLRWPRVGVPYHIGSDTSIVTLEGTRLNLFSSVFANAPSWSTTLAALDSAVSSARMVTRNSEGEIEVYFLRVVITGQIPDYGVFRISGYRIPVGPDSLGNPVLEYEREDFNGAISPDLTGYHISLTGSSFRQGCNNTSLIVMDFRETPFVHGNTQPVKDFKRNFSMNSSGEVVSDSTGFSAVCSLQTTPVTRTKADTFSVVRVAVSDTIIDLSVAVAPREVRYHQKLPALLLHNSDTAFCTWVDEKAGTARSKVLLPLTELASDIRYLAVPLLSTTPSSSGGSNPTVLSCSYSYKNDAYYRSSAFAGVVSNHRKTCNLREYLTQASYQNYSQYTHQTQLYWPGAEGWKNVYAQQSVSSTKDYNYVLQWKEASIVGYDQNRGELLAGIEYVQHSPGWSPTPEDKRRFALTAIDEKGTVQWKVDSLSFPMSGILPVDSLRYLRLTDTSGTLFHGRIVVTTYSLPRSLSPALHQRLFGPYFLRRSQPDSEMSHLAIYDFFGRLIAETSDSLPPLLSISNVIQRRSDSTLVFLWGTTDNGVHATILDQSLNVVIADTIVSSTRGKAINPAGVIVGDILYVAWEDYRNGEADIYGSGVLLPPSPTTSTVAHIDESMTSLIAQVQPNPTSEILRIEFNRPVESDTELELFNILGSSVWRGTITARAISGIVPLQRQQSGTYCLRWRCGDQSQSMLVVVVR